MQWTCPIRAGAETRPDALALTFAGQRWTYRELDAEVGRWVAALQARDVKAGDRVALLATNHAAVARLFFA
ncbi:AMP-binding protein, partial [Archangium sp.]|uniref:AMP-binding protein n=1 Tax=Archangium sp. TaxID=1872627 RepID=UPI002EDA41FA